MLDLVFVERYVLFCSLLNELGLQVLRLVDGIGNVWMVSLISSLVRGHFDVLVDIFRAEPASDGPIRVRAVEDTDCALVARASIIDADETILGASGEPAAVYDGPWTKLVSILNSVRVDRIPQGRVYKDLDDELFGLPNRISKGAHRWRGRRFRH